MAKPIKFILLTTQRSGSTWVMDVLGRQQNIRSIEEVFLSREDTAFTVVGSRCERWMHYLQQYPRAQSCFLRPWYLFKYLNSVVYEPSSERNSAVGFKLMYNQLYRNQAILLYAIRHRIRVIHLIRRNVLSQALSVVNHQDNEINHSYEEIELPATHYNPDQVLAIMESIEQQRRFASRVLKFSGLETKTVYYEDLCEGSDAFHDLLSYIGSKYQENAHISPFKRINDKSHRAHIRNYDEIASLLQSQGLDFYLQR